MRRTTLAVLAVAALAGCAGVQKTIEKEGPKIVQAVKKLAPGLLQALAYEYLQPETERTKLAGAVFFGFGKYEVAPEFDAHLNAILKWLKDHPKAELSLLGYADNRGHPKYNEALSKARADSVGYELVRRGLEPDRINTIGMGAPDYEGDDHDAYRRVDFMTAEPKIKRVDAFAEKLEKALK